MGSTIAVDTDVLSAATHARNRAEAFEMQAMLDFRDLEMARTAGVESPMKRQVERSAIALTIAEATGLSEGQVRMRLTAADTVRDQSPITWAAFVDGLIDLGRMREIATTIKELRRAESLHRLDAKVIDFAVGHTTAELRAWLRRFVRRVEADLATERAEAERFNRHVSVRQAENSMANLYAYLPAHEAAAIEARLRAEARRPVDPDDARTIAQREADLLVAKLLASGTDAGDESEVSVNADIAVVVDADVLAGANPGFAESSDGTWGVPAGWVGEVIDHGGAIWRRIVVEPVTGDVLSFESIGRFATPVQKAALKFLYGVCQAPGCMVPADRCDEDHRAPHPVGKTTIANLGPFCRTHHGHKGHGLLHHWSTRSQPDRPQPGTPADHPTMVIELYREPVHMEYQAA